MTPDPASIPAYALATLVMTATVVAAFGFVRRGARGERHEARTRAETLRRLLVAWLDGELPFEEAREAVRQADAGAFWTALESLRLGPSAWRDLTRVCRGTPHIVAERRALHDESPWRRELAARRLGLVRGNAERRALRAALVRGPEIVTFAAARALGRHRDAPALRWVISHPASLTRRRHGERTAVLLGFGRGAAPVLARALDKGVGDVALERAAVEALGQIGDDTDADVILPRLAHKDPDVRASAARALGRLRPARAALALARALGDPAWPVRAQAARALGAIGDPLAVEPLAAALEDASWWVRRHSAYALARLGPRGRAALERVESGSDDRYAREIAREALAGGRGFRVPRV